MAEHAGIPAPYVFLSYTSADRDRALAIADTLEQAGVRVWLDRQSIHGGTSWGREIVEGIRNCAALLVACSAPSLRSRNVRQEIQLAWRFEKSYLPLLLEPVEFPADVLYFLEGYQWIDLLDRTVAEWLPAVVAALAGLGVIVGAAPEPPAEALPPAGAAPPASGPLASRQGPSATNRGDAPGERRQVTAVACELADAASLAARLDPEDLQELVRAFQRVVMPVLEQAGGFVAQNRGDGLLVYFGYPSAHEDDARRAVRAALAVAHATRQDERAAGGVGVQPVVRIGIHTGLVVIDQAGAGQVSIIGETPTVAAGLPAAAPPGGIVLSAATERLVRGHFDLRRLAGAVPAGDVAARWQVLANRAAQDRLDAAESLTPLVGREQELSLLLDRWHQARDGFGQTVLIGGEAGIGKSRLLRSLRDRLASESHLRWEGRCSPTYQHSALYPVIDLLERLFDLQSAASPAERFDRLEEALLEFGLTLPEVAPLLAALLGLPLPARYPPIALTPERQRQKTLETLVGVILAAAEHTPLLLVAEDLHWVDPTTLELLGLLVEQAPGARLLVLLTARPEFEPLWPSQLTHLRLERLSADQTVLLAARVAGGRELPPEVVRQVAARTDGVPLFVEELTRMLLESGLLREEGGRYVLTGPLSGQAVPATLQESLAARLDRLGDAKALAQRGAVLGRSFPHELLRAVAGLDEGALQTAVRRLVEAGLLFRRGLGAQATYLFKHALVQDAAYQSLLRGTRQQYHREAAQALETHFPEIVADQPELLAHHYTEAGMIADALPQWQRAGEQAVARSAHAEAIAHLQRGLGLVATMITTPEQARQELALQLAVGPSLVMTRGFGAPEVEQTYARAEQLCRELGDDPQLFPVVFGQWNYHQVRGPMRSGLEWAERFFGMAEATADRALLVEGHYALADSCYFSAAFARSLANAEQCWALYDADLHHAQCNVYGGYDPGATSLGFAAWDLWFLGYPERAVQRSDEAIALARRLSHPSTLAVVTAVAAELRVFIRDTASAREFANDTIALATEQANLFFLSTGIQVWGWVLAMDGRAEEGVAEIERAAAMIAATGARIFRSYYFGNIAQACITAGRLIDAAAAVEEALKVVDEVGERYWEAEVHRLQGELLLQTSSDPRNAEDCFKRAIEVARDQEAKSLQLRASTSLARLWQRQGRSAEARQLLAEIYGWFTEGFDTADLIEARALLTEFSA